MIEELESKYPISKICKKLGVSRAGYYKYIRNKGKEKKETKTETELKKYITKIFCKHHKNYGYRKICAELNDTYNLSVGEKVVRRLMQELGLKSQARKEKKKSVSGNKVKNRAGHIYKNLLKRDFSTTKIVKSGLLMVSPLTTAGKKHNEGGNI